MSYFEIPGIHRNFPGLKVENTFNLTFFFFKPGMSKAQNVVAMTVGQILRCPGGEITVENRPVAIIVLIGQVKNIQSHPGRTNFHLDDKTGIMEITYFHDDEVCIGP